MKLTYPKIIVLGAFAILLICFLLFLLAGRIDYWQGWVFLGAMGVSMVIKLVFFPSKLSLLKERVHPGKGVKWWDKIIIALYAVFFFLCIIIGVLDVGRFHFGPEPEIFLYIISVFVFIFSIGLFSWAQWTNKFFSSMVRIQKERKQKVITNGPYKYVRHPGYVGGILMALSCPIVLGSYLALIFGVLTTILLIVRTHLEDETLKKELKGYKAYTKKTKYKLIPRVW